MTAAAPRPEPLNGARELRLALALANNCRLSFVERHSAEELVSLWRAYRACEWDYTPDNWEPRQIREALVGIAPRWTPDGRQAVYGRHAERCACAACARSKTAIAVAGNDHAGNGARK